MLEILYRIYQVSTEEERKKNLQQNIEFGIFSSTSKAENIEILMDVMICDSRDQFKQIIRDTYGTSIPFSYSKKLEPGQLYCIIIGEHCYDTERYFNIVSFTCDECGSKVTTALKKHIQFSEHEIRCDFYNLSEYRKYRFCSENCKYLFKKEALKSLKPEDDTESWVTRDMFTSSISGYIYKITKKSTGQFYVGQTKYAPMFRWAEHMKTSRFPISEIEDYVFEVLYIVPEGQNILEQETKFIQEESRKNPEKSLNISQTSELRKELLDHLI